MKIEVSFKTHCGEKPKNEMICPYEEVVIGVGRVTIINNIFRSTCPATITNHIIIIRIIIIITISMMIFIFIMDVMIVTKTVTIKILEA